jgi:S-adenosylmethionine hydrolase
MTPIALLTDFGLEDVYVGVMKGVLGSVAAGHPVIDISHGVPPQDVRIGALLLDAAWSYFPERTVFIVVVDPGVGTTRRPVVVQAANRLFVGPDNGVFGLLPEPETRLITAPWGLPTRSRTFHGRDLFAPVAGRLAAGARFEDVGPALHDPTPLALPAARGGEGEVLHIDHFGNAITNLPGVDRGRVHVAGTSVPVVRTYGEGQPGQAIALCGSTGRLEVAVRDGNAAAELSLSPGDPVRWEGE